MIHKKYMIVYEVTDAVSILRVLDTRTDYLNILLHELQDMRFPITQVCRPQELPRAACLFWRPLVEEILVVRIVQRVEFVLGADAAVQRLAVATTSECSATRRRRHGCRWC